MNDKELLELAAKAAGIDYEVQPGNWLHNLEDGCEWNPLTDDGDALRLAVKCELSLDLFNDVIVAGYTTNDEITDQVEEKCGDPYAATRLAIVRAAAEIGKGME